MSYFRKIFWFTFLVFVCVNLHSVWVDNLAGRITQPDGNVIDVLFSGDEFHVWAHDKNGFTMIQDSETGFWCWAVEENGDLVSTGHPIHLYEPTALGLNPGENISVERYQEGRDFFEQTSNSRNVVTNTTGYINSIVVFIRFSDDTEFTESLEYFDFIFNARGENVNSLYQYFIDASYGQLEVFSPFFPLPDNNFIVSYQSLHPRAYFQPFNAVTNPIGYQGGRHGWERTFREHSLLASAIRHIEPQVPLDMNLDVNGDGFVDSVNFMIRGGFGEWAELLWPHAWVLFAEEAFIHGVQVWRYNFNIEDFTYQRGVSVLAHELGHTLGVPDFYRYEDRRITPVGIWCLMSNDTYPPQSINAHAKEKYLGWINIPTITQSSEITLFPLSTSSVYNAIRVLSPNYNMESFLIEYRNNMVSTTDGTLHGSGLVIYRVAPFIHGNSQGPPDELYVFRPDGNEYVQGDIYNAFFSLQSGRTAINNNTNPSSFLSNGLPGGLNISNIGFAGESITFTVNIDNQTNTFAPPRNISRIVTGNEVQLNWDAPEDTTNLIGFEVFRNDIVLTKAPIAETSLVDVYIENGDHYYRVHAVFIGGNSPFIHTVATVGEPTIDTFPWHEGFEGNVFPPFGWHTFSVTYSAFTWESFFVAGSANTGKRSAGSQSGGGAGGAGGRTPDNWLITPNIILPENTENIFLRFYIGSQNHVLFDERLSVYVSILSDPEGFREVHTERLFTNEWQRREISLAEYANQTISIAFRHHDSVMQNWLKLDDIWIGSDTTSCFDTVVETRGITSLLGNFPNPFNPVTSIRYQVSGIGSHIQINIYNIRGQRIRTLLHEYKESGLHSVVWNGTDDSGRSVGSGIYFYRMVVRDGSTSQVGRMLLMK